MNIRLFLVLLTFSSVSWAAPVLPLTDTQIHALQAATPTEPNQPLQWQGDPLSHSLTFGPGKTMIFSEPVQVDLAGRLTTEQLRIINHDRSLYLTALKVIPRTRLSILLKDSQKIMLVDIETADQANAKCQVIRILNVKNLKTRGEIDSVAPHADRKTSQADDLVEALRLAWQQLYAPDRVPPETGFTRTPMHTSFWVNHLLYLNGVLAHPIASWTRENLTITAVELRNPWAHPTPLHVDRDFCGTWQAASLYPRRTLKPAGDKTGDSTTLFLISKQGFNESLTRCHGRA